MSLAGVEDPIIRYDLESLKEFSYTDACVTFAFNKDNTDELYFFTDKEVFKFNYADETKWTTTETLYKMENALDKQPNFAVWNDDQTKFIVTSAADMLYVDIVNKREVDIDEQEGIASIQNILYHKGRFFVLANKRDSRLGYYLLSLDADDPENGAEYLIQWSHKLDIGNCDLQILTEGDSESIVVSYKSIGINTYNVFVIDLNNAKLIKYWHEGYQLWESPVKGFLLGTNDFLILSKDGQNLIALGEKKKRPIKDKDGLDRLVHSVGSCNYLKIEPTNHIMFRMQFYDDRRICI